MVDIIFSIAAILISISYLATDILILRFLSLLGAGIYIAGGLVAGHATPGTKALLFFSGVNFIINFFQIIKIFLDRKPFLLPHDLQEIYTDAFNTMSPREFMKIYKLSHKQTAAPNEHLTDQNQPVSKLIFITNGSVNIKKNEQVVATLQKHYFVGEMSFITGGKAAATVEAVSQLDYIFWNARDLQKLIHTDPRLYIKFKNTIAIDLIKKVDTSGSD